ncbi:hypothetical protein DM02DRAFT_731400 [Periconia macrospinosa]|uniref:F-box domain-containing protein n=1 Tax=Periconia macrospinosa TaxID=97972 RepID=A0A2V1DDB3_9PLEO|nr:hypothetical protein DM02DRAFT_731400 [Periconia macrospinosa]
MSRPTLEALPENILDLVCEYLSCCDAKRKSLFAFSLVSNRCCAVSTRQRFKRVTLSVHDCDSLIYALGKWDQMLVKYGYGKVKQLKVIGNLPHYMFKELPMITKEDPGSFLYILNDTYDFNDVPESHYRYCWGSVHRELNPKTIAFQERGWQPLADFILKLPALQDLAWSLGNLLSDEISGERRYDRSDDIDPHEYAVATSSRLSYICAMGRSSAEDEERIARCDELNEAVLMALINRAPPTLEGVNINSCVEFIQCCFDVNLPTTPLFKKLRGDHSYGGKARLKSLTPQGYSDEIAFPLCRGCLQRWTERTDLEVLEHLAINSGSAGDIIDAVNVLLSVLNPLESLELNGPHNVQTIKHINRYHGLHLRMLYLTHTTELAIDSNLMSGIASSCPNLENIRFKMLRTGGNREEVATYQALGKMPRLKRATIAMDTLVFDPHPYSTEFSGKPRTYNTEEQMYFIRLELINSAIDETLLRAIFATISQSQAGVSTAAKLPFMSLEVVPWRRWELRAARPMRAPDGLCNNLDINARRQSKWECSRDPRDTHHDVLHVTHGPFTYDLLDGYSIYPGWYAIFLEAWKSLWPEFTGDFETNWHSLPLTGQEEVNTDGPRAGFERFPKQQGEV